MTRPPGASYLNGLWEAIQKNNIQRNGQNGAAAAAARTERIWI